jgi:hypothetical protein
MTALKKGCFCIYESGGFLVKKIISSGIVFGFPILMTLFAENQTY